MIYVPVSIGELVDKISILEIKHARISDAEKLEHIERELNLLRRLAANLGVDRFFKELVAELKTVNESIWDAEEGLRACETAGDFGEGFVGLTRTVYRDNDRRAAIKRRINLACSSDIVEEKSY